MLTRRGATPCVMQVRRKGAPTKIGEIDGGNLLLPQELRERGPHPWTKSGTGASVDTEEEGLMHPFLGIGVTLLLHLSVFRSAEVSGHRRDP